MTYEDFASDTNGELLRLFRYLDVPEAIISDMLRERRESTFVKCSQLRHRIHAEESCRGPAVATGVV